MLVVDANMCFLPILKLNMYAICYTNMTTIADLDADVLPQICGDYTGLACMSMTCKLMYASISTRYALATHKMEVCASAHPRLHSMFVNKLCDMSCTINACHKYNNEIYLLKYNDVLMRLLSGHSRTYNGNMQANIAKTLNHPRILQLALECELIPRLEQLMRDYSIVLVEQVVHLTKYSLISPTYVQQLSKFAKKYNVICIYDGSKRELISAMARSYNRLLAYMLIDKINNVLDYPKEVNLLVYLNGRVYNYPELRTVMAQCELLRDIYLDEFMSYYRIGEYDVAYEMIDYPELRALVISSGQILVRDALLTGFTWRAEHFNNVDLRIVKSLQWIVMESELQLPARICSERYCQMFEVIVAEPEDILFMLHSKTIINPDYVTNALQYYYAGGVDRFDDCEYDRYIAWCTAGYCSEFTSSIYAVMWFSSNALTLKYCRLLFAHGIPIPSDQELYDCKLSNDDRLYVRDMLAML